MLVEACLNNTLIQQLIADGETPPRRSTFALQCVWSTNKQLHSAEWEWPAGGISTSCNSTDRVIAMEDGKIASNG